MDCVAELPPTIVMAYETAESSVMQRVPRKMSRRMVSAALLLFAYMQALGGGAPGHWGNERRPLQG